ncbi:MAG: IscS subfamily cysteine desulfurase [Clostridia bacterium]
MLRVYADHCATTYVKEEVFKEMQPYFIDKFGNPSSTYSIATDVKEDIEKAREKVAKAINARKDEIYFTSCGSEADNLGIRGIVKANKDKGNHIITSKIEHLAVLETCRDLEKEGYEVTYLNVDECGKISLEELRKSIKPTTLLISIMSANNEIGTIQPIEEIGKIARENHVFFHTDSVQAIGSIHIDVEKMKIDSLSMSAHKFYGPKGVGAIYISRKVKFARILTGGHQEKNKRAGTENVAGIIGLGKAIELATLDIDAYAKKLLKLREYSISKILKNVDGCILNGHRKDRLPGNINFSFKGVDSQALVLMLDLCGICASSGSACNSSYVKQSHVIEAIRKNKYKEYTGNLRISYGDINTEEDAKYVADKVIEIVKKLRKSS